MTGTEASSQLPIPPLELAFRVGITGARQLEADAVPRIRVRIEEVLRFIKVTLSDLGTKDDLRPIYAPESGAPIRPRLRALTPLADGADRIFADVAGDLGYEVDVALPFDRSEYAKDFDTASRADFDRRLDAAGARPYLALDGGRGDEEDRSYEAVGRIVVRNCDLLIAVWDGRPAKGRGGTADIVRFATKYGPPVWWIDVSDAAPARLIRSAVDLRRRDSAPQGDTALATLRRSIRRLAEPPGAPHHSHHGFIGMVAHLFHRRAHDPLCDYLGEVPRPDRRVWRAHGRLFRLIGGKPPATATEQNPPVARETAAYWSLHHKRADQASVDYSNRYRSSYVLVIALATLAVAFTVGSLACHECHVVETLATIGEIFCLGAILSIVGLNERRRWHDRWIAYRLLAELCRKQEALALLGWSLPASDLRRFGADASPAPWVGWYFDALLRAAPFAEGNLSGERLRHLREIVLANLISGQAAYHRGRQHVNRRAAIALAWAGEGAFLLTCAIVIIKAFRLLSEHEPDMTWLAVSIALLPALSAAFVGIRGYSEVALLQRQSQRLEAAMIEADERVRGLDLDRVLASQDLAADVYDLSAQMLQDVNGWADLFVIKAVEAS